MTGLAQRLDPPSSVRRPGSHLGLRWRPLIAGDAPGVYDLCQRTERADDAIRRTAPLVVANMVEGAHGTDVYETIVGLDSQRTIVAAAWVKILRDIPEAAIAVVGAVIDPKWRGRGVGRSLLHWQVGRARQLLVEVHGADSELPASIVNYVDSHMADRRRLHIAAGFSAKRTFQLMYRELEGGETMPKVPDGYRLVTSDRVPVEVIHDAHMAAFLDHYRSHLRGRWWKDALPDLESRWSWILLDGQGEVAAYSLAGRPTAKWAATGKPEAYVYLVGVLPGHRGRSLASVVLGATVASAAASGMPKIGLDVDTKSASAAHAIYEHFGFVDERAEVLYAIDL
ncbi:GNAT family N-acetyltransferase [Schaalia sp. 19OD2882]|uniref:GNAT family N-acetyltransferase n=1 Tax=Schaalia sp. 19OD2882 TaxID=2794089 RepID=UPI001C1ECBE9|nr:GNAT family N-acetyltransferase [Schaalia sp. 19OD2882]QWW18865.1 GNAT family N-acetyltransferase [Schaalia sp. 19OD2882]